MINQIFNGDCLELMKDIPDKSIDMILCDLPYGTTACKWDTIIPFEPLWEHYSRIIKDNGAIALFGSQPFTSVLVSSNIKNYKHHWVWKKNKGTGFQVAKYRPMMATEDIIVFCKKKLNYNPQMVKMEKPKKYKSATINNSGVNPLANFSKYTYIADKKYPINVLEFNKVKKGLLHPTQKPVDLLEYLIKTYTNENEVVLDNCMGAGSTIIAAINTNRNYVGIELDKEIFQTAKTRIENHLKTNTNLER